MTGLVRIRAKAPTVPPSTGPYPSLNGILPSWVDMEFFVVAPDGSETPMTGVRSVKFEARDDHEALTATLEVLVDEFDVAASLKRTEAACEGEMYPEGPWGVWCTPSPDNPRAGETPGLGPEWFKGAKGPAECKTREEAEQLADNARGNPFWRYTVRPFPRENDE